MALKTHNTLPVLAFCLALSCAGGDAPAADADGGTLPWRAEAYPYLVVDQSLADTLDAFGRNLDLAVEVSADIDGRVRHYRHEGSAGTFLDRLTDEHDLDWVVDRGRLFISRAADRVERAWPAGSISQDAAQAALTAAGIEDARFPLGVDHRGDLSLAAPPRYMARVAAVLDRSLTPKIRQTVNVVHGRARESGS